MNARNLVAILATGLLLVAPGAAPAPIQNPKAAADPQTAIVLLITPSGAYDLVLDGATGQPLLTPSLKQYTQVIDMTCCPTPGPSPTPIPPVPTPSPVLTDRAKLIKAAAEKVTGDPNRASTAQGLAVLYREIAKQIRIGAVADTATLEMALRSTTDALLVRQGVATQWQPFRDTLSTQWTAAKLKGIQECAALLEESAAGLDASAPGKSIDPAFWKWLIETLLPILIALLKPTP